MKLTIVINLSFFVLLSPVGLIVASGFSAQLTPSTIDASDETGLTQLMQAAWDGDSKRAKNLLKSRASTDLADQYGWTALNYAIAQKHSDIVKALLAGGATVKTRDRRDRTPLMWAAISGKTEIVRMLITGGSDMKASDKKGLTAYSFAVANENNDVTKVLREAGGAGPPAEKTEPNMTLVPIDRAPKLLNAQDVSRLLLRESIEQKMMGIISLRILIGRDGKVSKVKVIKKLGDRLTESAIRLAFGLQTTPPQNDGTTVEYWYPFRITFGS
ncbi:MAG: ankyrin repeat domain-containing protein [Pyrinomonadaceae bacterium]